MISGSIKMRGIKKLKDIKVDLRESQDKVGSIIRSSNIAQMNESRGKTKWDALAPATLKKPRRTKRPFDTKKRDMWESFTKKSHPDHVENSTIDLITVGSDMEVADWQMNGTDHIPSRSIEVTPAMATEVVEEIADEVIRSIGF